MKTLSVFLVDDDPFIREVLVAALEVSQGVHVQSFAAPDEALRAVEAARPDIIVLDYTLPGTDGLTVYREMRRFLVPMPPVVFLTARDEAGLIAHLKAEGAAGVLAKPFDPMSIAGQILRLGEKRSETPRDTRLDAITASFRASLPQAMAEIDAEWGVLRHEWQRTVAESLIMRAHKLAGAAGLFKMAAFGDAARAVEVETQKQFEADGRGEPVDLAGVAKTIAALWEAAIAAVGKPT